VGLWKILGRVNPYWILLDKKFSAVAQELAASGRDSD